MLLKELNSEPNSNSNSNYNNVATIRDADEMILDQGPYRWLLIDRQQPLTKLTENYLLEILADNWKRQHQTLTKNQNDQSHLNGNSSKRRK
ncbi:hypothetical protein QR98_0076400 [Sarcoptes scabiei]|uniref:Uncharacterized protein n=1 Tax=Sarcoptes scabiei TaxID=52283 RepID=A0A132AE33_SARSC|nr:hypothetical protein QR98_0076400 [Sarcoptes scabiei]